MSARSTSCRRHPARSRAGIRRLAYHPAAEPLERVVLLSTFTVVNTDDGGNGSLRWAIEQANQSPGSNVIDFRIGAGGLQSIRPASPLPSITGAVTIDGTTQPDYNGMPLIELDGSAAGDSDGLSIRGSGVTVRGLIIDRWTRAGVLVAVGAQSDVIAGNFIGTDPTGKRAAGNHDGVVLDRARKSTVGGTTAGAGNVIAGNTAAGIMVDYIGLPPAPGENVIQGNLVGTDASGTEALGNHDGIVLNGASMNTVGGTVPEARNVIAGNAGNGVAVVGVKQNTIDGPNQIPTSHNNVIQGNFIGTNASGTEALGNGAGVLLQGASANTVGGSAVGARNVIAGNSGEGIALVAIGTGVRSDHLWDDTTKNVIQGNFIGVDTSGLRVLGNGGDGVSITASFTYAGGGASAGGNSVGGTTAEEGNVISANGGSGVVVSGMTTNGTVIAGNFIGTDRTGAGGPGNQGGGIAIIGSSSNTIGGTVPGARNVVSSNGSDGIAIKGAVYVLKQDEDPHPYIARVNSPRNLVSQNFIGTDVTGTEALGNNGVGVRINDAAENSIGAGNVIAANGGGGIAIAGSNPALPATGNQMQGNLIGTDANGTAALGNRVAGVSIMGPYASGNAVGSTATGAGNVISGNVRDGLTVNDSSQNLIAGNFVGTDVSGTERLGNGHWGVIVNGSDNTVGGTAPGAGNVISGNADLGLALGGSGNRAEGNLIGIDVTGTAALGNQYGMTVSGLSNTVGGTAQGAGNVIAASDGYGVLVYGDGQHWIAGNWIGTDVSGMRPLGNGGDGIWLQYGNTGDTIGGTTLGAGNVIRYNGGAGVRVDIGTVAAVLGNSIDNNGGLGIVLQDGGNHMQPAPRLLEASEEAGGLASRGTLTAAPGTSYRIEFFASPASDPSGFGEGRNFLGDVTVSTDASRHADVVFHTTAVVPVGWVITATATDPADNTSQFSNAVAVRNALPGQTWVVTTTADSGPGSLRQAILDADATGGGLITFAIPGAGPHVIITTGLPDITAPVNLDATSEPGYAGTPLVTLDGGGALAPGLTLVAPASGSTIRGLMITEFGAGIDLESASLVTIQLNVLSGNRGNEVNALFSSGDLITGNLIGTDATGTTTLPNTGYGVVINGGSDNTIGGTTAGAGNIIAGNLYSGVYLIGDTNLVSGNRIGTDVSGTLPLGNGSDGIIVTGSGNTIGGTARGAGNVIAASRYDGVVLFGTGHWVAGNRIGTDKAGAATLPNGQNGISVADGSGDTIGGTAAGAGNLIAGNRGAGVALFGAEISADQVAGNDIRGNGGDGVLIFGGASSNTIGGTAPGAGNTITANAGNGVTIGHGLTDPSAADAVLGDLIFGNAKLAIDLGDDGVTPNTPGGPHAGPNRLQNYPVLSPAISGVGTTTVAGTLESAPSTTYRVEFFADPVTDPSGFGQGQTFLGAVSVTTDASGRVSFTVALPVTTPAGWVVSAIASDSDGNTSEFSRDTPVT